MPLLLLVGCEKVLDIDDNNQQRKLVVNAVPTADQRLFVNFSYTHFFLDNNNSQVVDGAELKMYVNNVAYTPDSVSNCNYFFPVVLAPDDSLRLEATTPRGNVYAETYVPRMPNIDSVRFASFASSSFNFYTARFNLHDHANYPEYYNITVMQRDSGERYNIWTRQIDTVDTIRNTYFLIPNNPNITASDVTPNMPLAGYLYTGLMCTDKRIDGADEQVQLYIMHLTDTNEIAPFKHEYTLRIESATYDRFRYLISVASANSMSSFFAEQAQPYTNISGGVGIFAGTGSLTFRFDPDTLVQEN